MRNANVGIVVVTWNKKDDVLRLLASLEQVTYPHREVTVVDNASTDATVEAIRERYPATKIIVNCENLGGTGGFNTGMQYFLERPDIEYLWLLDNDAVVSPNALSALVSVLDSNRHIAAAGSAMYDLTRPERLIEVGNHMSLPLGRIWGNQRFALEGDLVQSLYLVDSISACSMCVRKTAVCEVGLWDRNYFLYFDDVDWNVRFRKHGYKIAAVPTSVIWHMPWEFKPGFTATYYASRNVLYLMSKHLRGYARAGILLKEARLIVNSFLSIRKHPFRAILTLIAVEDFLVHRQGRYRGKDPAWLERAVLDARYRLWAISLMRILSHHALLLVRFIISPMRRLIRAAGRRLFCALNERTRVRIAKCLNYVVLRGK